MLKKSEKKIREILVVVFFSQERIVHLHVIYVVSK